MTRRHLLYLLLPPVLAIQVVRRAYSIAFTNCSRTRTRVEVEFAFGPMDGHHEWYEDPPRAMFIDPQTRQAYAKPKAGFAAYFRTGRRKGTATIWDYSHEVREPMTL